MSIMFFKVRSISRAGGGNAVVSAAYVSRSRIVDVQTGRTHDFRRIPGLAHSEIMLPGGTSAATTAWASDRSRLWNAAEVAEGRRNSRVGREYTVALPHELPDDVRIGLARELAQRLADRHGVAVDIAVHRPGKGDPRNHHVHLLATTRELDDHGFTRKATIERNTDDRRRLGLAPTAVEYRALRAAWASSANDRLREAGLSERLEPRSRRTLELERQRVEPERENPDGGLSVAQRAVENWKRLKMDRDAGLETATRSQPARRRDLDHGLDF